MPGSGLSPHAPHVDVRLLEHKIWVNEQRLQTLRRVCHPHIGMMRNDVKATIAVYHMMLRDVRHCIAGEHLRYNMR